MPTEEMMILMKQHEWTNRLYSNLIDKQVKQAAAMQRLSRIYFALHEYNDCHDDVEAQAVSQALQDLKVIAHETLDEENREKFFAGVERLRRDRREKMGLD